MTNSQDIRSQKDTDSGSNAISLLNELNQVSTAIDALRSLDLPPFLDSSSIDSFNKAKKDTYLTWFATVLDEAALASILIVKDLYNLDIRNAATLLEDTVKLPSAMTAFKAALAKLNTVEVALLAAEKAIVVTDKAKLLAFTAKMNQIEAAIQQLSDKIEASAFQIGANIAITYIKVGINVATEESPVMPLVQGVVKVGESIAKDFVMTAEINKLDNELYAIVFQIA
jgi:glutaredoxin 2